MIGGKRVKLTIFLVVAAILICAGFVLTSWRAPLVISDERLESELVRESIELSGGEVYYYGGDYPSDGEEVKVHYFVSSSARVDIYIVDSEEDSGLIKTGQKFGHNPSCMEINSPFYDKECVVNAQGGIAILNDNEESASVKLRVLHVSE